MKYKVRGKRIFDLLIAIPISIFILPLYIVIYLLLRATIGKPVLFKQIRPGIDEKSFTVYKFRTMTDTRDRNGNILGEKERITSTGKIIRKMSLDELPQLYNVIKGDMSLVGPRPLFKEYLLYYTERERIRHSVKPGITGLAQINGRNKLNWDERLEKDVEYVENLSFMSDLKILILTIWKVIRFTDVIEIPGTAVIPLSEYRRDKDQDNTNLKKLSV